MYDGKGMGLYCNVEEVCYFEYCYWVKQDLGYEEEGEFWFRKKGCSLHTGRVRIKDDGGIAEFLKAPEKDGFYQLYNIRVVTQMGRVVTQMGRVVSHMVNNDNEDEEDSENKDEECSEMIMSEDDYEDKSDGDLFSQFVDHDIVDRVTRKFEVDHDDDTYVLNLETRECNCYRWSLMGIPCWHALICILKLDLNYEDYIHPAYHIQTYAAIYAPPFKAMPGQKQWEVTPYPKPNPPTHIVMPGRPSKRKIRKEQGEDQERQHVKRAKK
ncbi:Lymphocyte antigen 75 [Bienertia sinuspersici]